MTERMYVNAWGVDDDAVRLGFAWLTADATAAGESRAVLSVNQLGNVENLGRGLGSPAAAALRKARRLTFEGVTVELAIERDARLAPGAATLAVWPSDRLLERLEHAHPRALCVVPWNEQDVAEWLASYGPCDLRTDEEAPEATLSSPVVEAALVDLTVLVNLTTGLGHPSDRDAAVSLFRILKDGGYSWDPAEVRAWAASHGWGVKGAKELEHVASAVREGRRIRGGRRMWREDILDLWRSPRS